MRTISTDQTERRERSPNDLLRENYYLPWKLVMRLTSRAVKLGKTKTILVREALEKFLS